MKIDKTFIIAEAGVNHNGSLKIAKEMIEIASLSGVDAIKFQTFKTENLIVENAEKAEYQKKSTDKNESQFNMLKKLELDYKSHEILIEHCRVNNIEFLSAPFDLYSIDLLIGLELKKWKIPSGEITNLPYLRKIASLKQPVFLSTGLSNLAEIQNALDILISDGLKYENITILHCNTEYPTPFCDVNLNAMLTIKSAFPGVKVGYSDHTLGIEVPIAAKALGAKVIEKHFTLDRNLPGPDHKASLEPDELKKMVVSIRNIEMAMGNGIKKPTTSEANNLYIARKSIVASKEIKKGDFFSDKNLSVKRPGNGISPMLWDQVIGGKANKDYNPGEAISL